MKTADLFPQMLTEGLKAWIGSIVNHHQVSVEMNLEDDVCLSHWAQDIIPQQPVAEVEDGELTYAVGAAMGKFQYQLGAMLRS